MGGSSSKKKEFIPPDYPKRKSPYDDQWVSEIRNSTTIATYPSIPSVSNNEESTFSSDKLETLVDKIKDLYETIDTESYPVVVKALFACLGQVWAGVCLVNASIALNEKEKNDFNGICAKIEEKFTELCARDSVIRLRGYVWEIERILNRPIDENTSNQLDRNVNFLMQELMIEGTTSPLEEIYAYLGGGYRGKMERYILHILHFLFNGMNKNNELILKKFGAKESEEYIRKQYNPERRQKIVDNICKILQRFDENLKINIENDFDKNYNDFDFMTFKYDWLHLHLHESWQFSTEYHWEMYSTSNFTPYCFKRTGEYYFYLHYIPKSIWIDPSDEEIASARQALREAEGDWPNHNGDRHVLMAKRLNQRKLAWWGIFYGTKNTGTAKFSSGYPTNCSVVEWLDPFEWRVLLCGRNN